MRVTVWIPDDTEEWLREKAQSEVRSMSNYLQLLIERERQREEKMAAAALADDIPLP